MLAQFRNSLTRNWIQEKLFAQVTMLLEKQGPLLKKGSVVDSAPISAPPSTQNTEKERDSRAHSTEKENIWHLGYKAHIGIDKNTSLVHTVKATAANVHDVTINAEPLSGEEGKCPWRHWMPWSRKEVMYRTAEQERQRNSV